MSDDADSVQQDIDGDVESPDEDTGGSTSEDASRIEGDGDIDALAAEVAQYDEEIAAEVGKLEAERDELQSELETKDAEVDELTERVKRVQADFKNYKERSKRRLEDEKSRATEDLVTRLLDVRDNLDRALEGETEDVDALREGVELTRNEFDRVLDQEGVKEIRPDAGTDVDAKRHEVMMRVPSDESEGSVAEVYRAGYEMGGKVLRAAQVTVSDGASEASSGDTSDKSAEDSE